ncbi:PadR family transcriptional regulator [Alkalihalobacillus pseudalcaliphilus]|uniref:PadR family transcriptional regulator n=1 Tax=Alkalihalobacillus pseudalcaliphilus TaxID=79884 RepID=UPI00064E0CF5|nr:PadR family transcriptional regulator [Alkalihalobacillus pseudalcaliphilus]KMK78138.1 hypothetical protein AB990_01480 [Alkalihalobacillus pseudalcaliphilus]
MSDPLKNLKKSMHDAGFEELTFSQRLQKQVLAHVHRRQINTEQVKKELLALLNRYRLTGFEVMTKLDQIGEKAFENDEGTLYKILHQLEQDEFIIGSWDGEDKYYVTSKKGKKYLKELEKVREEALDGKESWT